MKTTLNLDDALVAQAKAQAAKERTTLTRLIEEGLKARLRRAPVKSGTATFPIYKGKGGLKAPLSGLNNKELLEAAE